MAKDSITVAFRIDPKDLAKALDGLMASNLDPTQFTSISQIVRATFYSGIISLCDKPTEEPTNDSIIKINQMFNQNKRNKNIGIKDLMGE